MKKINIQPGDKFDRWTVLQILPSKNSERIALCKCECGTEREVKIKSLTRPSNRRSSSCGCLTKEVMKQRMTKHDMINTRMYNIWKAMKQRCNNKSNRSYKNYGGRGITICDEWESDFINFYNDMKKGYADNLSIDRIDNNNGYSKYNCRWSTQSEQMNNTRRNRLLLFNGKKFTASRLSEKLNKNRQYIGNMISTNTLPESIILVK